MDVPMSDDATNSEFGILDAVEAGLDGIDAAFQPIADLEDITLHSAMGMAYGATAAIDHVVAGALDAVGANETADTLRTGAYILQDLAVDQLSGEEEMFIPYTGEPST
jgi:hypothetical protein